MSLPYYKRFPRDFLDACVGLPFELRAGYGMILDLIYLKDGKLPLDKPWIAGHLGCSVRMVSKIIDGLEAAGKLVIHDGFVTNDRADKLLESSRYFQDNQREIASRPRKNNDLRQPEPSQSESESEKKDSPLPPKGEKKARRKPETALPDDFPDLKALQDAKARVIEAGAAVKIRNEAERFRNHAAQTDRKARDWSAAWRNWILNAIERAPALGLVQTKPAGDEHDPWPYRMRVWERQEGWNDVDWGPEPGQPGCRVPPQHLKIEAAE